MDQDHSGALIGYSGFVGSNLTAAGSFEGMYNSKNIENICGRHYSRVVCAGASAVKWLANQQPEADWLNIRRLIGCLNKCTVDRFVLISTIDVYTSCDGVTESVRPSEDNPEAYGRHRYLLERFVCEQFPCHHIVRLPALFGPGLKKNAIYDLIHQNRIDKIPAQSRFQWYPIRRLNADLQIIIANNLPLVNVATEPISMQEIVDRFFPNVRLAETVGGPGYDIRTEYAALLGGSDGYHLSRSSVLTELGAFLQEERRSPCA